MQAAFVLPYMVDVDASAIGRVFDSWDLKAIIDHSRLSAPILQRTTG